MKESVTVNTKRMRIMIGILGMLLPWLVALITLSWPQSISITYYSLFAVGTFMVVLGSAGILLINYKGYEKIDDITATIAGIFGILICLFPMTYLPDPSIQTGVLHLRSDISNIFHCVSAFGFFATLAFMSFFLFTKTSGEMTKQKKIKNIIYRVCGVGMLGSFILMLLQFIPGFNCYNLTWIVEAIALFFFGFSWIVKSDAFPCLQDKKKVTNKRLVLDNKESIEKFLDAMDVWIEPTKVTSKDDVEDSEPKKKVFRVWKYKAEMTKADFGVFLPDTMWCGWPQVCDGKTKDEMLKMGFGCYDSWLVDEDAQEEE